MTDLHFQVVIGNFTVGLRHGPAVLAVVEGGIPRAEVADAGARVAEGLRLLGVGAVEDVEPAAAIAAARAVGRLLEVQPDCWFKFKWSGTSSNDNRSL